MRGSEDGLIAMAAVFIVPALLIYLFPMIWPYLVLAFIGIVVVPLAIGFVEAHKERKNR